MDLLHWTSAYSVGNVLLDAQHKKLFQIFNRLVESNNLKGHQEDSDFHEQLNELVLFTKEHIKTEDALMAQYGYDGLLEHKNEHIDFENELTEIVWKACQNRSDKVELIRFIYVRWIDHILHSDQKFHTSLNRKAPTTGFFH